MNNLIEAGEFIKIEDAKPAIPIREPHRRPIPDIPNPIKPRIPEPSEPKEIPTIAPKVPTPA